MSDQVIVARAQESAREVLAQIDGARGSARGGYVPSWRDRVAHRLASLALLLATREYRALLTGAWGYGLAAAVRDEAEGRPAPEPLRTERASDA